MAKLASLFPHILNTQMQLWNLNVPKIPRGNNQNKVTLSKNMMKEHSFTLQVNRYVVEDDLPVILTPQLTL